MRTELPVSKYVFEWNKGDIPLHLNEFSHQHSKSVISDLMNLISKDSDTISKYNNRTHVHDELLDALSAYNNVVPENILLTNGADDAIKLVIETYSKNIIVIPTPTYRQYERFAALGGKQITYVKNDTLRNIKDVLNKCDARNSLVTLCNPNNPDGRIYSMEDLEKMFDSFPETLFLLDETYVDYAMLNGSVNRMTLKDNVVSVRSFSKAFGMAGLRLGYLVATEENIKNLEIPFNHKNVPNLVKGVGLSVLKNLDHYKTIAAEIKQERDFAKEFFKEKGFTVLEGPNFDEFCNFITIGIEPPQSVKRFVRFMEANGILVRDISSSKPGYLRLTIGTPQMMKLLYSKVEDYLASEKWSALSRMKTHFHCITMNDRKDRYDQSCLEFQKVGLDNLVQHFHARRHKDGGTVGCWMSHRHCIEKTLKDPEANYAFIFEDDVTFDSTWKVQLDNIIDALKNVHFDVLYVGGLVYRYEKPGRNGYIWKGIFNNAHAYIISRDFMERCYTDRNFSPYMYHGLGVDDYYKYEGKNNYILVDQFAWQRNDAGSETKWYTNDMFQKIFQHKWLYETNQKVNNKIAWYLRGLPYSLQTYLNPISCMFLLNEKVTAFVDWFNRAEK